MKRFQFETKTILNLALPALLTQASYTLTSMFDLMMVGSLSPEAIAGGGVGGILFWNLAVLFAGPLMAMGYLCAQSYGAGDHEQFFRRVSAAFILSIIPAIFMGIFNTRGSILLYRILGAEPEVVRIGTEYFRFRLIGFPFELANMGMESMIKATGNTKRPMIIRFISHLANLLLNYILIFGKLGFPRMEAAGAGLATLISYLVATALFVIYVFRTFKRPENRPLFPFRTEPP
jgi:putative MATE family efflux protein